MKRLQEVLGYVWAILVIPAIVFAFGGMSFLEQKLILEPGLHVSARWTGGEVVQTLQHGSYRTLVHRPVFDGLFWETSEGFVQIDWQAEGALPDRIDEEVDFDRDGTADFRVQLNTRTNEALLFAYDPRVLSFSREQVLVYENSRTVRVVIRRK